MTEDGIFMNIYIINTIIEINIKDTQSEIEQIEIESRLQLNNEIIKLRQQMQDQQNDLYNQINFLKEKNLLKL